MKQQSKKSLRIPVSSSSQTPKSGKSNTPSVYENKNYKVVVGVPPVTSEVPQPVPCYLIINRVTNVLESWHSVLFYAKQNADVWDEMLEGKAKSFLNDIEMMPEELSIPGEKKIKKGRLN